MAKTKQQIPKYLQISRDIVSQIRCGDLAIGERVPSENEIIRSYEVSNTTARKALVDVEQAGWVTRIKARGSYVRANKIGRSVDRILGFNRNMIEAGHRPSTKVIDVSVISSGKRLVVQGRQIMLPGPVCRLERLRFANDVPMMKEVRYVSKALCPDIERQNLEESLYDLYERHYGLDLVSVDQSLGCVMLDTASMMDLFELDHPVPAFRVEGATACGKDLILEIENSLYRGDVYRFSVKATRTAQ